jgi:hypothetical protein
MRALLPASTFFLLLVPRSALACSCVQAPPETAFAEHDAVFEGRVAQLSTQGDALVATFEVVQHWKGIEHESAIVRTPSSSAACGVSFEVGTSWLVYADREGGLLTTGLCSRTRRIEDAEEDVAALGAGVVPIDIRPEDEPHASRLRPVAAGCASCTAGGTRRPPLFALALLPIVAGISRCRSPSRRAGVSRPPRADAGTRCGP